MCHFPFLLATKIAIVKKKDFGQPHIHVQCLRQQPCFYIPFKSPICQGKRSQRFCHFLKEDIDHGHVQEGEGAGGGRQHPGEQRRHHGEVFKDVFYMGLPLKLTTKRCFTFFVFLKGDQAADAAFRQ